MLDSLDPDRFGSFQFVIAVTNAAGSCGYQDWPCAP
jgi:hypothetical protein